METPTLKADFIRLEPLTLSHLAQLEKDFDPSLFDFYPKPYPNAREFVEENLQMQKQGNFLPFVIIHNSSGLEIGCTEFSAVDNKNKRLEIGGTWLKSKYHGSPANAEAKYLLLQYAFETLKYVRVQITANVLNQRSRAAIEKLGAKFEGVIRNAMILPNGKLRDDAIYSFIPNEWADVKANLERRILKKGKRYVG